MTGEWDDEVAMRGIVRGFTSDRAHHLDVVVDANSGEGTAPKVFGGVS